jgi:restriction endonuclease S subunit
MYKIPIPPIKEQDRIVREIDKLSSEISRAIARVQELELGVQEAISKVWDAN